MNDMNRVERDQLIEEAAALPVGDPRRQELIARIDRPGAEGDEMRTEWAERSASYESIRRMLKDVVPPAGLAEQLLLIPTGVAADRSGRRSAWRRLFAQRAFFAAAAAIVVALVLGFVFLRPPIVPANTDAFDELVALMIDDHMNRPSLAVESSDPREIERHLNSPADHPPKLLVRVPEPAALGEDFRLHGGRLCKFEPGGRPIAYTRWDHRGIEHSLYQVEPERFALPPAFQRTEIIEDGHRVVLWLEDDMAYGLVCPH